MCTGGVGEGVCTRGRRSVHAYVTMLSRLLLGATRLDLEGSRCALTTSASKWGAIAQSKAGTPPVASTCIGALPFFASQSCASLPLPLPLLPSLLRLILALIFVARLPLTKKMRSMAV